MFPQSCPRDARNRLALWTLEAEHGILVDELANVPFLPPFAANIIVGHGPLVPTRRRSNPGSRW